MRLAEVTALQAINPTKGRAWSAASLDASSPRTRLKPPQSAGRGHDIVSRSPMAKVRRPKLEEEPVPIVPLADVEKLLDLLE